MSNSNLHPQEVADNIQQTILAAMKANHEMSVSDLQDALPSIDKRDIVEALQDGVKRGIYDRVAASNPVAFVLHEEPQEISDGEVHEPEEPQFKRHTRAATGLKAILRTYVNEQREKNETFGLKEMAAYSGFSESQVRSAVTNLLREGTIVIVERGRRNNPAVYRWREEDEKVHVAGKNASPTPGIMRGIFVYLAETGEHINADDLRVKTGYKWTADQVAHALNSGFREGLFSREHWTHPYQWYVEYNKRQQWRKEQVVPKKLEDLDPLMNPPQEEAAPQQEAEVEPQQEAQQVEVPFTGEEFNAFMDIHGNLHMRSSGMSIDLDPETSYKLAVLLSPRLQFPPKED